MINSKKKGNLWENRLANWLTDNGIKASKDGASGGGNREKGDIVNNINCTIESKAAKNIKTMEWWKQVVSSADKHHNTPLLFIHQDGMREDEWLVVLNNYDWLDLVKGDKKIDTSYQDPKIKWDIKNAVEVLKKLLKHYDSF